MSGESPDHGGGESPADHRPARRNDPFHDRWPSPGPVPARPRAGWDRPTVSERPYSEPRRVPEPRPAPYRQDYGESPSDAGESPH